MKFSELSAMNLEPSDESSFRFGYNKTYANEVVTIINAKNSDRGVPSRAACTAGSFYWGRLWSSVPCEELNFAVRNCGADEPDSGCSGKRRSVFPGEPHHSFRRMPDDSPWYKTPDKRRKRYNFASDTLDAPRVCWTLFVFPSAVGFCRYSGMVTEPKKPRFGLEPAAAS